MYLLLAIPTSNLHSESFCNVSKQRSVQKANELRNATVIIWDEVVMMDRWAISAVDRTLRDLCSTDEYFGGKVVVFSGDFRQILPVLPKEPDFIILARTIKSAHFWPHVDLLYM